MEFLAEIGRRRGMTVPMELRQAQVEFDRFLVALRDHAMLQTTNQTYTMLEAVLLAFRRRLLPREVMVFADALPPILRAIFVKGWDPSGEAIPFLTPADHQKDVMALRPDHNLSTPTAIRDVGETLRTHLGAQSFAALLAELRPQAREFWQG